MRIMRTYAWCVRMHMDHPYFPHDKAKENLLARPNICYISFYGVFEYIKYDTYPTIRLILPVSQPNLSRLAHVPLCQVCHLSQENVGKQTGHQIISPDYFTRLFHQIISNHCSALLNGSKKGQLGQIGAYTRTIWRYQACARSKTVQEWL